MTELALVFGSSRADGKAVFEALMRRHERMVLATALGLLGNLADAQDAAQEVLLRLYRNLDRIDQTDSCAGWLYRVTVNVCRDMLRKRRPSAGLEAADEVASEAPDPQRAAVLGEQREALQMLLRRLSEGERAAMVLRDLEGLSAAEAAAVLGTTEATVRSQSARARIKAREWVRRRFGRRG